MNMESSLTHPRKVKELGASADIADHERMRTKRSPDVPERAKLLEHVPLDAEFSSRLTALLKHVQFMKERRHRQRIKCTSGAADRRQCEMSLRIAERSHRVGAHQLERLRGPLRRIEQAGARLM